MVKENPANAIKDTMWHFLMDGGQKANIPGLKDAVYDLIKMATQKSAGQKEDGQYKYGKVSDLSFANLDMTLWSIVFEATALVLSGRLDELEDAK